MMSRCGYILLIGLTVALIGCRTKSNPQSNYDLGKQLRCDGQYAEAMTCFLDVLHSEPADNALLGRVWSNIADICQMERNYTLAYAMHVHSAECFLLAADSIHYYYALNNMAIQRALQQEKPATMALLAQIEAECSDSAVLAKTLETYALACLNVEEYDSAKYYVDSLFSLGYNEITGQLIKAQALAALHQTEAACDYARRISAQAQTYSELNNCYYILTHYDHNADTATIRDIAIRRASVQGALRLEQGDLAHAVDLLQQDLETSRRFPLIYAVGIAVLLIVGTLLMLRRRKMVLKLEQQTNSIQQQLDDACRYLCACPDLRTELMWSDYDAMCRTVNVKLFGLAEKLQQLNVLNENDIRLCVLVMIGLPQKQIAQILYYSPKSIGRIKENTALKLNKHGGELGNYLRQLVINSGR